MLKKTNLRRGVKRQIPDYLKPEDHLTIDEFAAATGMTRMQTYYRVKNLGVIPHQNVGHWILIPKNEIENWKSRPPKGSRILPERVFTTEYLNDRS